MNSSAAAGSWASSPTRPPSSVWGVPCSSTSTTSGSRPNAVLLRSLDGKLYGERDNDDGQSASSSPRLIAAEDHLVISHHSAGRGPPLTDTADRKVEPEPEGFTTAPLWEWRAATLLSRAFIWSKAISLESI